MLEVITKTKVTPDQVTTKTVPKFAYESCCGVWGRKVRMSLNLTQKELAERAGVTLQDVELFENNAPVSDDTKHKLLEELWEARSNFLL